MMREFGWLVVFLWDCLEWLDATGEVLEFLLILYTCLHLKTHIIFHVQRIRIRGAH